MTTEAFDYSTAELLELFEQGEAEVEGRMPYSSNATLLVTVRLPAENGRPERAAKAIYKPGKGERPLWDFEPGLYKREAAMYHLSEALGFGVVPPTTIAIGPFGEGSFQAFVDADFSQHYFTLVEAGTGLDDLRRIAVLDLIANNTDRKSGHCLAGRDGRVYAIDHGLAFHVQDKLRTVMWDFIDEPIPDDILDAVRAFVEAGPPVALACLLDPREVEAMMTRAQRVLDSGRYPDEGTDGRRWPWPLV